MSVFIETLILNREEFYTVENHRGPDSVADKAESYDCKVVGVGVWKE